MTLFALKRILNVDVEITRFVLSFPDSESPCSCVGFDIDSTMMEPFIPEYNMTSFVYDMS